MTANLRRLRGVLCGVTVAVVPGLLADQELYMHWWVNDAKGLRQLDVSFDPRSRDFYDYRGFDWFTTPVASREVWLSDPYYDEGGANADIVTVSIPAQSGKDLVGVATADIDLGQIGRLVAPALAKVGAPAALVGDGGVVVASCDRRLAPGEGGSAGAARVGGPGSGRLPDARVGSADGADADAGLDADRNPVDSG